MSGKKNQTNYKPCIWSSYMSERSTTFVVEKFNKPQDSLKKDIYERKAGTYVKKQTIGSSYMSERFRTTVVDKFNKIQAPLKKPTERPRISLEEKSNRLLAPLKKLIYEWKAQNIFGREVQQIISPTEEAHIWVKDPEYLWKRSPTNY